MKKGFRGTTTEEIARKAGLTKGALYFHFRSKEEVLFELIRDKHNRAMGALRALPRGKASPTDVLEVLLDQLGAEDRKEFGAYLDFWMQALKIPKVYDYLRQCLKESDCLFVSRIDPRYAPTPRERRDLGGMIFSILDGLIVRNMLTDKRVNFGRQVKLLTDMTEGLARSRR